MVIRTFASVAVISALGLLAPIQAYAFGLGNIETSSALNEPFKAEIVVTAIRGDEAGNLQVRLASNEEFERAGIERHFLLTKFKFDVVEKAGSATIFITSKDPVKEPFVDFLVTATTGNGRLIREYTVLLDPPTTVFAKPTPTPKAVAPAVKESTQKSNVTSYQYDAPSSSLSSATSYGPTDRTDTLWDIALKTKQEKSISVHQQMIALVKENPRAFNRQNINGLKAGYTLSIPSADVVKALSKSQAISTVREQNTAWKNRNSAPVAIVEEVVMPVDTMENVESEMASTESVSDAASPVIESENTARLKLVAPNDEALLEGGELSPMGSDELSQLSEQLTLAQETIEGQAQENIDIKSRMDVMEEQIQTLRRLISLKDADLARLQSSLEQDEQIATDTTTSLDQMTETLGLLEEQEQQLQAEPDAAVQDASEMSEVDQYFASIGMEEQADSMGSDEDMAADSVVEESMTDQADNEIAGIDLSAIPSIDEVVNYASNLLDMDEGEVDSLLAEVKAFITEHKMETMSGGLLILLILWLLVRRSNRPEMTWDEAVEKLDDSESVIAPPVYDAPESSNEADEMLVEELTEEETTSEAQEEIPEIEDPEAESEVLDALDSDDTSDMEQETADLASNIDSLASEEIITDEALDISENADDDLMNFDPNESESMESEEISNEPLSFEVNSDSDEDSASLADETLTLDIGGDGSEEKVEDADLELNIDVDDATDASLEIEGLEEISEDEMTEATEVLTDANDLEFDLDDFDEVDEAETKLDLAAAYIDMGDPEGAKSILDEVSSEGNEEQKTRAQSMLKDLS